MSDIDTAAADGLKVLDPKRPIREADMAQTCCWLDPVAKTQADVGRPFRVLIPVATIWALGGKE